MDEVKGCFFFLFLQYSKIQKQCAGLGAFAPLRCLECDEMLQQDKPPAADLWPRTGAAAAGEARSLDFNVLRESYLAAVLGVKKTLLKTTLSADDSHTLGFLRDSNQWCGLNVI